MTTYKTKFKQMYFLNNVDKLLCDIGKTNTVLRKKCVYFINLATLEGIRLSN